ncbi:MAG TPA: hypothetical protein VGN37_11450 [Actinocatenispora sp.]
MAFAEKRGNLYRARWRGPSGKLESKPGFPTKRDAENYAKDQEAAIRGGTYVDPRAGQTTLTEWVNRWFPAQDLEPSTLADYRNRIEVRILPAFGDCPLASLTEEAIAVWEMGLVKDGYARSTARAARTLLATILGDAIPRYIQANPAARRRGKGRKGRRRVERLERSEKVWPSPLQALLVAERCAALSGHDAEFVMMVTAAYTGMRWSELSGLAPQDVRDGALNVHWKLYELDGRFYRGRPKDGSVRTLDLPPFLQRLLVDHLRSVPTTRCTCHGTSAQWCDGTSEYAFLGPRGGHHRRSTFSRRVLRPAADGWYPKGRKPAMPVLVDAANHPGILLTPWPAVEPGDPYTPPRGRGRRLIPDETPLASWLPVLRGLTPHGLRHGHQTWMDEADVARAVKTERMGHELPGMQAIYSHISPTMRDHLVTVLERLWSRSLADRARMHPSSTVPIVDRLLAATAR